MQLPNHTPSHAHPDASQVTLGFGRGGERQERRRRPHRPIILLQTLIILQIEARALLQRVVQAQKVLFLLSLAQIPGIAAISLPCLAGLLAVPVNGD